MCNKGQLSLIICCLFYTSSKKKVTWPLLELHLEVTKCLGLCLRSTFPTEDPFTANAKIAYLTPFLCNSTSFKKLSFHEFLESYLGCIFIKCISCLFILMPISPILSRIYSPNIHNFLLWRLIYSYLYLNHIFEFFLFYFFHE